MASLRKLHESLLRDTIREFVLLPFRECSYSVDTQLHLAFGYPFREITKRMVVKPLKLTGYLDEEGKIVSTTRTLRSKLFCFIRTDERESTVDIEARCDVFNWNKEKKRGFASTEWFTFRISKEDFKKLDEYFGPGEDVCITKLHKEKE